MIKNSALALVIWMLVAVQAFAQWSKEERERISKLNQEDHQLMMNMLGITEIRPGPSGDPKAPNAANSDESKATPYTTLPDPLLFDDGSLVQTPEQWEKRRLEIFEHFDREIYGRMPENAPAVTWEVVGEKDRKSVV